MKPLLLILLGALWMGQAARAQPKTLRVLTITGDWKSQTWYQDVWMQGKGADGKGSDVRYRGRFIARETQRAAPNRFEFTDITNYTGQQYGDADFFSQFDVVWLGDIVGWSLPPRFLQGLKTFVQNGGGVFYAASWKWGTATLGGSEFEEILPARFGTDNRRDDWKSVNLEVAEREFVPAVSKPSHPIVAGLDWSGLSLDRAFKIQPKDGAQILLKSPGGAPLLAAWEFGRGRGVLSASINANDELSGKIGNWNQAGKFYAQLLSWAGANSTRRDVAWRESVPQFSVSIDANRAANAVSAKLFGIHASHDNPGLAPLEGEALKNFEALNLRGAFTRFSPQGGSVEAQNDNDDPNSFNLAAFDFKNLDGQMEQINRLGLEPILLLNDFYGNPKWFWGDGSSWSNPSEKSIAEIAEYAAACIEHFNGKRGAANYKLNIRYLEIANEPDLQSKTIPGFARLFKGVAARIHRDYPGVQVGTFGGYEVPYLPQFLEAVNPEMDWISRHPYGWTGEMVMAGQDAAASYMKEHNLRQIPFIITEWDFWIQGREKFDYMMRRNFETVQRENLLGTLHYRLGQYNEPIYLFGVLWVGWGKEREAHEKGTPMHDAYDAFWLWKDFRGVRIEAHKSLASGGAPTENSASALDHLHADAVQNGDVVNAVLYLDWGASGAGFAESQNGWKFSRAKAHLKMTIAPSARARTLTISRANGEGFETGAPVVVKAGATNVETDLNLEALTGYSVVIR